MHAGVGLWLIVMGGRTADVGWFRTKTDTFLNDICVMDRYFCRSMTSLYGHKAPYMLYMQVDHHALLVISVIAYCSPAPV